MSLTYRQQFNKKYGFPLDASHSLQEISNLSGYDLRGLRVILAKGEGAYFSDRQSVRPNVTNATQWGMARVYSAVMGGKASKVDATHLL